MQEIRGSNISPVLIVTPWYKPTIGGVAEVADRLHHLLAKSGVETHLLVCDPENPRHSLEAASGKNIWRMKIPSYIFYNKNPKAIVFMLIRGITALWQLSKFIHNYKIRTVILLFPIDYVWPFIILRHLTTVKLVASYHGNDLTRYENNDILFRWLIRKTLLTADAITVCAKHLAEKAQKIAAPDILKIQLISNCVDSVYFLPPTQNLVKNNESVTLIHVSNFNQKKRTQDIVQAFAMASLPQETRLVMVGCGPSYEETLQLASTLGIADRVEFVGARKDVRPYLWKADIFVLASDDEGAPLVLLEAMASGLAWISTPWGAAESLPPGECGLVVPPGAPEKLAAAMEELVGNPARRQCMGNRGKDRVATDFSVHNYIEKHYRLIRTVQETS